jgi:beta-lactam-binding protein with PASTA domain
MLPFVRRRRPISRGQALVEFALILPVLVMLLLLAIDFGRVFFGWVALNNASRIAANEAAFHPEAWEGSGNAQLKGIYRNQVTQDLQSINCAPAGGGVWQTADVPDPTYIDEPSTPTVDAYEIGDHVRVTLTCHFSFLTPLVGFFMGDPMPIQAASEFSIKGGEINGIPVGNAPPGGCLDKQVPNMVGISVSAARSAWTSAGFTGAFSPASGQDTETVATQNTTPASNPGDCLVATATVVVTTNGPPACTNPNATVPNLVGLTVTQARTTWSAAGFNNNTFSPASGSDSDQVTGQTTSPSSSPGDCRPKTTTVTVTHTPPAPTPVPNCTMPQLFGTRANSASGVFRTAGFTGVVTITHPPRGNYNITTQSLVAGQSYPCTSGLTVGGL